MLIDEFLFSNLKRETYCKATSYKDRNEKTYRQPEWYDLNNNGLEFKQSNNIAPTEVTPILVSGEEFVGYPSRVLTPMVWGMIPPWHKVYNILQSKLTSGFITFVHIILSLKFKLGT